MNISLGQYARAGAGQASGGEASGWGWLSLETPGQMKLGMRELYSFPMF